MKIIFLTIYFWTCLKQRSEKTVYNNGYTQCGLKCLDSGSGRVFEHRQIFWIWLWRKKDKDKQKDLADRWAERQLRAGPALRIAQPLAII